MLLEMTHIVSNSKPINLRTNTNDLSAYYLSLLQNR